MGRGGWGTDGSIGGHSVIIESCDTKNSPGCVVRDDRLAVGFLALGPCIDGGRDNDEGDDGRRQDPVHDEWAECTRSLLCRLPWLGAGAGYRRPR